MIRNVILMVLMLLSVLQSSAQVELVISEMKVSNIKPEFSDDVINEDIENGPFVLVYATFYNTSKEDIVLKPSEASYYLMFNHDDKKYRKEIFPLAFSDFDSLQLKASQKIEFYADDLIFFGTSLFKEKKENYTMELLKALPTLKLIYRQPDGFKVVSTSIEKVIINK